jgi:farnesyl-diphosphate farnesyltransferase
MGVIDLALLAVTRPSEFRSLVHYKVWRDPLNDIKENPKESGWDREQMRDCWKFLDLTSRSFSAVIKELRGELSRVVSAPLAFNRSIRLLDPTSFP